MTLKTTEMENNSKTAIPSFQYFFRADVFLLQWTGLSSFNSVFSSDEFNASFWDGCHFFIAVSVIGLVVLSQITTIFYIGVNLNDAIEINSTMCTIMLNAIKAMRWWTHRHQLYNILRQLSMEWETSRERNYLTIEHLKAAENAKNMRNIYIISVGFVIISYNLRPYIMYLNYLAHQNTNDSSFDYCHTTVFSAGYPFPIESLGKFCAVITYQQISSCIGSLYWIS
ncbi:hypothetical protein PV326_007726, partial [Microctonus aethiopoides]